MGYYLYDDYHMANADSGVSRFGFEDDDSYPKDDVDLRGLRSPRVLLGFGVGIEVVVKTRLIGSDYAQWRRQLASKLRARGLAAIAEGSGEPYSAQTRSTMTSGSLRETGP